MAIVFDIETVGEDWSSLDAATQKNLAWYLKESARDEDEYAYELKELQQGLGLSPLTGFIVAIGAYDTEQKTGAVYFDPRSETLEEVEADGIVLKPLHEKQMLEKFWEIAAVAREFVSFNGRGFDAPYLAIRSLVHGVKPTKDLLSNRYLSLQRGCLHVDLLDQLSFYGAARFKKSLHLFCRALSIESPKAGGTDGDDVAALYKAGKTLDIARYNAGDLRATAALYERWKAVLR
jgi:hypothetical protein